MRMKARADDVIAAYKGGETLESIAQRTGLAPHSVYSILNMAGEYKNDHLHAVRGKYVRERMREAGLTYIQIARDLHCSQTCVYENLTGKVNLSPGLLDSLIERYGWDRDAILQEYRLKTNRRRGFLSLDTQIEIYEKYNSGSSVKELMAEYKIKESMAYKAISIARASLGLTERGRQPAKLADALYPKIEEWRVHHNYTLKAFANELGTAPRIMRGALYENGGKKFALTKELIDTLLSITGMTYEQAFKIDKTKGGGHWK